LLALLCVCPEDAAAQEIHWFTNADKAWRAAKQEKRPLLIYFTSSACHWCTEMKTRTFGDRDVTEYVRKTFVALSVKAEDEEELVKTLQIEAYPTTVLISPDRKLLGRMTGYVAPAAFRKQLAEVTPKHVTR
jgi:uncharacterized protein YyaL (SSP411 family)